MTSEKAPKEIERGGENLEKSLTLPSSPRVSCRSTVTSFVAQAYCYEISLTFGLVQSWIEDGCTVSKARCRPPVGLLSQRSAISGCSSFFSSNEAHSFLFLSH